MLAWIFLLLMVPQDQDLEGLRKALENDPNISPEVKEELLKALKKDQESGALSVKGLKVKADFRFRIEGDRSRPSPASNRNRYRVRGRLQGTYDVNEQIRIGARVVTRVSGSPDDINSTHVTLGREWARMEFDLDRLFVQYTPDWWEDAWFKAGKFPHPARTNPVYGELVWDGDVQPEGIAVLKKSGPVQVVLGAYLAFGGGSDEGTLVAGQISLDFELGENASGFAAVGYWHWANLETGGVSPLLDHNAGNASVGGTFTSDFHVVEGIFAATFKGDMPVTVSLQVWKNNGDEIGLDTGWAVGGAIGKLKAPGDLKAYVQYQEVETDSVFSPVAQDDFQLTTNFTGPVAGVKIVLWSKVVLHVWVSSVETETPDGVEDHLRWRIDLNIST